MLLLVLHVLLFPLGSPGLLDFSPEEIRLEAYKANAEGKADVYVSGTCIASPKNRVSAVRYSQSSRKWTPSGCEKVSVAGAGCLQEYENTGFVWEFNKTGFD